MKNATINCQHQSHQNVMTYLNCRLQCHPPRPAQNSASYEHLPICKASAIYIYCLVHPLQTESTNHLFCLQYKDKTDRSRRWNVHMCIELQSFSYTQTSCALHYWNLLHILPFHFLLFHIHYTAVKYSAVSFTTVTNRSIRSNSSITVVIISLFAKSEA